MADTTTRTIVIGLLILLASLGNVAGAADATSTWRKVLKKCAESNLIGKQHFFFGLSNSVGPGSVWTFAPDRSVRLQFELSDAFPAEADRAAMLVLNPQVSCSGDSTSNWNVSLGLPFTTGTTPITADVAGVLGAAKEVTVSVSGYSIDLLKAVPWQSAFDRLGSGNAYRQDLNKPERMVAANAVKIVGFKARFKFKSDLGADIQAKFTGSKLTIGKSSSPSLSTPVAPAAPAASETAAATPAPAPASDPCTSQPDVPASGDSSTPSGTRIESGATLRAFVVSQREIVMCANGPFYLLAAYSKVRDGTSLGVAQDSLVEARLPRGSHAAGNN